MKLKRSAVVDLVATIVFIGALVLAHQDWMESWGEYFTMMLATLITACLFLVASRLRRQGQ